jgi:hypothetical protein
VHQSAVRLFRSEEGKEINPTGKPGIFAGLWETSYGKGTRGANARKYSVKKE